MAMALSSLASTFTSLSLNSKPTSKFISLTSSRRSTVMACDSRSVGTILAEAAETAAGITPTVNNMPAGWTIEQYMKSRLPGGIAAQEYLATGRRKCAIARVALQEGDGKVIVNYRDAKDYFQGSPLLLQYITSPLMALGMEKKVDIFVKTHGGGISGQAQAICLGVARALVMMDEECKPLLKKDKLLTRDSRVVERKKAGLRKARKRPQYSKR